MAECDVSKLKKWEIFDGAHSYNSQKVSGESEWKYEVFLRSAEL